MQTKDIHMITTDKYGMVVVTDNSQEQEIIDDSGILIERIPAGMVMRWQKQGESEPSIKFVSGVFATNFRNDEEIRYYIENNKILG